MSSDRQEASPKQQREEITKLANREGYRVLRWYTDEAISGDATEKRVQFKQMVADAASGDFEAVLVWDQDRFGRFDSIEAGHWIYPLRQAGVCLFTVAQLFGKNRFGAIWRRGEFHPSRISNLRCAPGDALPSSENYLSATPCGGGNPIARTEDANSLG